MISGTLSSAMNDCNAVLIVGGSGEFGKFLQQSILPLLGIEHVVAIDRESTRDEQACALQQARHLVLAVTVTSRPAATP